MSFVTKHIKWKYMYMAVYGNDYEIKLISSSNQITQCTCYSKSETYLYK